MKVRGKAKFDVPRKTVRLVRTVSGPEGDSFEEMVIRVRALPVGAERKMFELFPEPERPQDYVKDGRGMVLRDPDTKKPVVAGVDTPKYLEDVNSATKWRMAYMLYHGIDDPEVKFETEGDANTPDFYKKVFEELVSFGFTMGDLGRLMSDISDLMNISNDLESAKGN